jgi:hypothetical protein
MHPVDFNSFNLSIRDDNSVLAEELMRRDSAVKGNGMEDDESVDSQSLSLLE